MSPNPTFTPQLLGQTEKTLNAILDRHLAGAGLTEQHWITLSLGVLSGGSVERERLVKEVAGGAKFSEDEVRARISELVARQLLDDSGAPNVNVTEAGKELHGRIREANFELTERLWGDMAGDDLATTARVLATVLERANAELARA